jgi:nuclear pore complex protein Nup50
LFAKIADVSPTPTFAKNFENEKTSSKSFKYSSTDNGKSAQNGIVNGSKNVETTQKSHPTDAKNHQHRQLCKHLKVLNEGVLNWTQKHLKTNPYLDLTPIFQDYINHYKDLEKKFGSSNVETSRSTPVTENGQKKIENEHVFKVLDKADESTKSPFSFQPSTDLKKTEPSAAPLSFSFGQSEKRVDKSNVSTTPSFSFGQTSDISKSENSVASTKASFSFGQTGNNKSENSVVSTTSSFSFGQTGDVSKSENSVASTTPSFSFGQQSSTNKVDKTFSFSQSNPSMPTSFMFGSSKLSSKDETEPQKTPFGGFSGKINEETDKPEENDDAEYQPPEPESAPVEEKDAFFTIKCKLFFMSGKDYRERSVGMLYLIRLNTGKTQLLIRSDTSLGKVLLNVVIADSMLCTRTGKNNVSLVCVPNPSDPKIYGSADANTPVTFLIRVKTAEDADELLEKMTKPSQK